MSARTKKRRWPPISCSAKHYRGREVLSFAFHPSPCLHCSKALRHATELVVLTPDRDDDERLFFGICRNCAGHPSDDAVERVLEITGFRVFPKIRTA